MRKDQPKIDWAFKWFLCYIPIFVIVGALMGCAQHAVLEGIVASVILWVFLYALGISGDIYDCLRWYWKHCKIGHV